MPDTSDGYAGRESGTSTDETSDDGEPSDLWLIGVLPPILISVLVHVRGSVPNSILINLIYLIYPIALLSLIAHVSNVQSTRTQTIAGIAGLLFALVPIQTSVTPDHIYSQAVLANVFLLIWVILIHLSSVSAIAYYWEQRTTEFDSEPSSGGPSDKGRADSVGGSTYSGTAHESDRSVGEPNKIWLTGGISPAILPVLIVYIGFISEIIGFVDNHLFVFFAGTVYLVYLISVLSLFADISDGHTKLTRRVGYATIAVNFFAVWGFTHAFILVGGYFSIGFVILYAPVFILSILMPIVYAGFRIRYTPGRGEAAA